MTLDWAGRVFNHSCESMREIPDGGVHLVVTSPPYDGIRTYGSLGDVDLESVISELARVVTDGGVACWVVQDQTRNFAKTDTSINTVRLFIENGFRRFETLIYKRPGAPGPWWNTRLRVDHEYIHVFFKGDRPRVFHKPMTRAIHAGKQTTGTQRKTDGEFRDKSFVVDEEKCRGTVWEYAASNTEGNPEKLEHPATFPDALASDLIQAFSDDGDIVLDPFMGSGTTAVMADVLRRSWTGYEINPAYYDLILRRTSQRSLFGESA